MAMILGSFGTEDNTLFCAVNGRKFRIHLPETDGRFVVGSSSGWLVLDRCTSVGELRLQNPLTQSEIELPPASSYVTRVALSSDPLSSDCSAMIIGENLGQRGTSLSFCRIGDYLWTDLDTDPEDYFQDVAYHRKKIYAATEEGKVVRCDTSTWPTVSAIGGPEYEFRSYKCIYLVSSSGELSMVTRRSVRGGRRSRFTLGDENYYASLSAKGNGGERRRNHVYFSDRDVDRWDCTCSPCTGVFNMEKSTMEPLFDEEDYFPRRVRT